ncbi:hypothetical protein FRC11_011896 [Ceratobasidium sp. 423]|nr:hypothetical protein FRC11_011896 [Ceratobasidium sp. 423]
MSAIPATAQVWCFPVDQKIWNGHKSLELREVTISPPKQGEVLVKLHAAALNYRGCLPWVQSQGIYPGPYTCGPGGQGLILSCDDADEVVAVGEGITQWKKGDRVHSLFFETWFDGPIKDEHTPFTVGAGTTRCLTQYRIFDVKPLLPISPQRLPY